jgi:hypothetical protein
VRGISAGNSYFSHFIINEGNGASDQWQYGTCNVVGVTSDCGCDLKLAEVKGFRCQHVTYTIDGHGMPI